MCNGQLIGQRITPSKCTASVVVGQHPVSDLSLAADSDAAPDSDTVTVRARRACHEPPHECAAGDNRDCPFSSVPSGRTESE